MHVHPTQISSQATCWLRPITLFSELTKIPVQRLSLASESEQKRQVSLPSGGDYELYSPVFSPCCSKPWIAWWHGAAMRWQSLYQFELLNNYNAVFSGYVVWGKKKKKKVIFFLSHWDFKVVCYHSMAQFILSKATTNPIYEHLVVFPPCLGRTVLRNLLCLLMTD